MQVRNWVIRGVDESYLLNREGSVTNYWATPGCPEELLIGSGHLIGQR